MGPETLLAPVTTDVAIGDLTTDAAVVDGRVRSLTAVPSTRSGPSETAGSIGANLERVRAAGPSQSDGGDRTLRGLDLIGAALAALLATPVLMVAALAIRVTTRGPVLYSQDRIGRHGRPFRCHKLRTMHADAEQQLDLLLDEPCYHDQWTRTRKLTEDPRVTRIGRLLRLTDLDELPQLWNVLRGEMSLVGPRPVPADEAERYGADLDAVLSVRPGMTGMWQVGGRHDVSYDQRIALDVRYVSERSMATNLRLIGRTVLLIATGRNGAS